MRHAYFADHAWSDIRSIQAAVYLIDQLSGDRVIYRAITLAESKLGYVQLAESDRGLPGHGHVPWEAVFEGLHDADYTGPLAFESFTIKNVVLARAACLWRDVVGDPDVFVVEGRATMRSIAEKVGYRFPGERLV